MKRKVVFNSVSETLLINLYMRYLDSLTLDSLLKDEFSGEIVNKIDFDFSKFDGSDMTKVGAVIRAKFFDDEIIDFYTKYKDIVIVQIGAGFDTRPLRLENICENATFYDLDLPDVIKQREVFVKKAKNNFDISASMLEEKWMDMLLEKHPNSYFIFVLEGVSMYLEKEQLQWFFDNISKRFKGIILLDLTNKFFLKYAVKKHDLLKKMNAEVKFGTDHPEEIETWGANIKYIKKAIMLNMYKNRWSLKAKIMRFFPAFKNACNMFVYSINMDK